MNAWPAGLETASRAARVVGAIGLILMLVGFAIDSAQFYRSYLTGFLFVVGLALGSLAWLMLGHLVGGEWSLAIRRILEGGARTLPLTAALFLPVVLGAGTLYGEWLHPHDDLIRAKSAYLNLPFFGARSAAYFLAWLLLALAVHRGRGRGLSAPGLLVYGFTMSFAAVDWAMSVEPHWLSASYGLQFIVGQGLSALAFAILILAALRTAEPFRRLLTAQHFRDLGTLLFAFVLLWAYLAFTQYLIIWSANLPEEIPWYRHRVHGGWQAVAVALLAGHFAVPFALLLSRGVKERAPILAAVAAGLLLLRLVDLHWMVQPGLARSGPAPHWLDLAVPAGLGGIWLRFFLRQLKGRSEPPPFPEAATHA